MKNLVILISGSGSNLQSIIDTVERFKLPARICAVISNRPGVYGLERAKLAGIKTEVIDHKQFNSREEFDGTLQSRIDTYHPDHIILAGFMRILTEEFVAHYLGKMVNIHPSLLPKYPGLKTHARALEAGDHEHGATVHFVTPDLDGGPAILQAKVAVQENDTPERLAERVLKQEHIIYPTVIYWLVNDWVELIKGKATLEGSAIGQSGYNLAQLPTKLRLPQ